MQVGHNDEVYFSNKAVASFGHDENNSADGTLQIWFDVIWRLSPLINNEHISLYLFEASNYWLKNAKGNILPHVCQACSDYFTFLSSHALGTLLTVA